MALHHVNYVLTPKAINAFRPAERPYMRADGGGLYIEVLPGGSKVWRFSYRFQGKRPKLTLGTYPALGIKDARDQHEKLRAALARGEDPAAQLAADTSNLEAEDLDEAIEAVQPMTFAELARLYVTEVMAHRSVNYREQTIRFFDQYIGPTIGSLSIHDVKPKDVLAIMEKYKATARTADMCRAAVSRAYKFAIRKLLVDTNPAAPVTGAIELPPKQHHRHLSEAELGRFWCALERQRTATAITTYCAKLLMLTMVRKGELRLAQWREIDFDKAEWSIPAQRMKNRLPHLVPLSAQAVAMLRDLYKISGHGRYVFPTRFVEAGDQPIGDVTLNHLFKRLDFGVPEFSPHGTRGTAATLLREHRFDKDVVELLLAHKERDETAAAYTWLLELIDERRRALQFLADKIEQLAAQASAP